MNFLLPQDRFYSTVRSRCQIHHIIRKQPKDLYEHLIPDVQSSREGPGYGTKMNLFQQPDALVQLQRDKGEIN